MSTQKGNSNRSRPQKYRNQTVFKNDLHDKSHKTKFINNIEIQNVCERCKKIIEWKIKYKKYKPLKTPTKCIKCEQKTVKHAYHNMCSICVAQYKVCAKCGENDNIIEVKPNKEEVIKLDTELQNLLKELSERKRRTFIRYMNRNVVNKGKKSRKKEVDEKAEEEEENKTATEEISKEDLLLKLKSLIIKGEDDDDNDDFDTDDDDIDGSDSFT
ncbi:unnamed protein product [Xylocopa violacea]|uniref:Uncharacterized protein n=1 Tax=Xylocopa violacea TaxID=135666 RepID=A0ABP1PDL5_XYLVO